MDEKLMEFREELLEAVTARASAFGSGDTPEFAFLCEVATRLANAEEFQDFIPCHYKGTGYKQKKLRVDGYELDDVDDSIRLLICDFSGGETPDTITKTKAEALFSQTRAFIEDSASGRIWGSSPSKEQQTQELSSIIENKHKQKFDGSRSVSRYHLYLLSDSVLSDRLKDLPTDEIGGIPVEFHIWDIERLKRVSDSQLGTEEIEVDFTQFETDGLPCLQASVAPDYSAYLCVVRGDILARLYDQYGSRLMEGNVRSFLSTTNKVNRAIQKTIRAEPGRFFVLNNGISATATNANVLNSESGLRLHSVKYLQIVNGGQTTASLHAAMRRDGADLTNIHVQMKLSIVHEKDTELLDEFIQQISRCSNSQTKVSDADFFSSHPFHRMYERLSRNIQAPRQPGATYNTYWFYERARGQYQNAQSKLSYRDKKNFQIQNPRSQFITKTDLAKYENSWRMLPYEVSKGAQKNFLKFADLVTKHYGEDGKFFDNDLYFRESIAKAILFRYTEGMVSNAKSTWYGGGYRAQIVTYTIAKLAEIIQSQAHGYTIDFVAIWQRQGLTAALGRQLEEIAKAVSKTITAPPIQNMDVGEWCKNEKCWEEVRNLSVPLLVECKNELLPVTEAKDQKKDAIDKAQGDKSINALIEVFKLHQAGVWSKALEWSKKYNPLYGRDADLIKLAERGLPTLTDRQANAIMQILRRLESEGFKR
jgi:hypothetical protein